MDTIASYPRLSQDAIAGAANAIFSNHGQCCSAGLRLMVHQSVFEGVAAEAGKIKVGLGLDPETQMWPLVSEEPFRRVTGYVKAGSDEGARIAFGGKIVGERGYFIEPTVLTDTTPQMKMVREEIFGSVVCALPFADDDPDRIARGQQHELRPRLQRLD